MILVDTHILIWDAIKKEKLPSRILKTIEQTYKANQLACCAISFWEIAMLMQKGRLNINIPIENFLDSIIDTRNYSIKNITPQVSQVYLNLGTKINRDPADGLIVATAIAENIPLITADKNLLKSDLVETIW